MRKKKEEEVDGDSPLGRTICDVYGMEAGKELPAEEFIVKFLKGGW